MFSIIRRFVRHMALEKGRMKRWYLRICHPTSTEYGEFIRRHGGLYSVGEKTTINIGANITDPAYVRIGSNCSISSCTLLGHDAVVRIINNIHGTKLDSVGKIDIKDNSFVGHGAIVMPGVTIGPDSVVAAGSVVTKDVPPGMVVGGVPAKVIGTTAAMVERLTARSKTYPWQHLIEQREGSFDAAMEPELIRMRVEHFYGKQNGD